MPDNVTYRPATPEEIKAMNLSPEDIQRLPRYNPNPSQEESQTSNGNQVDKEKGIKFDKTKLPKLDEAQIEELKRQGFQMTPMEEDAEGFVSWDKVPRAHTYEDQGTPYIFKDWQSNESIDHDEIMSDDEKAYLRDAKNWMKPEDFETARRTFRGEDPKQQEDNIFTRALEGAIEGAGVGFTVSGFTPLTGAVGAGLGAAIGATIKAASDDKKYYFDENGIPRPLGRGELPPPGSKTASVWGFGNSVEDDNAITGFAKNATNMLIQTGGSVPQLLNILAGTITGKEIDYLKNIESDIDAYQFQLSSKAQKPIFSIDENGETQWDFNAHNTLSTIGQALGSIATFMGAGRAVGVSKETNAVTEAAKSARALGGTQAIAKPLTLAEKVAMNAPWKYPKQWLVGSMINMSEAAQSMRAAGLDDRSGYAATLVTALGMGALEMMIGGQELTLITKRKIFTELADQITKKTTAEGVEQISAESIDDLYKATIKSGIRELARHGKGLIKGGFSEATEETVQDVYSKFVEFMHDKFPSTGNKYGTEMLSPKSIESYVNSAIGGFAGAPIGVFTGDVERTKNEEIYRHVKNGTENRLLAQMKLEAKQGFIDQSEYEDYEKRVGVYKEYRDKLKGKDKNLNDDQRKELFEALWQHRNASELMTASKLKAEAPNADPIDKATFTTYEKEVKAWQKKVEDLLTITPEEAKKESEKKAEEAQAKPGSPEAQAKKQAQQAAQPKTATDKEFFEDELMLEDDELWVSKKGESEEGIEKEEEPSDVVGSIVSDDQLVEEEPVDLNFKTAEGKNVAVKDGFVFLEDKPAATARTIKTEEGTFVVAVEKPTDDEEYSDLEKNEDGDVTSAPRKKGTGFIVKLNEKGEYESHKEFSASATEEGKLTYGALPSALRQIGVKLKKDEDKEKKAEGDKKRQEIAKQRKAEEARVAVKKRLQGLKGFTGESSTVDSKESLIESLGIIDDENSGEEDFSQDNIDSTFSQQNRENQVRVSIQNGYLYEQSGKRTLTDKRKPMLDANGKPILDEKGKPVFEKSEVHSGEKQVKLHRLKDKNGNEYLVGATNVKELEEGKIVGTAFLLQLDATGKKVVYSKRFYYQANQKQASNWDGLLKVAKDLSLTPVSKKASTEKQQAPEKKAKKVPFTTKQQIIDKLRELSQPYKFGKEKSKEDEGFIGFNRLVDGEKKKVDNDAVKAGLVIDKMVRDFFSDKSLKYEDYKDEITKEAFDSANRSLKQLKTMMERRGETVVPEGITLADKTAGVKSEMDLVTVDDMLQVRVYDVKTFLRYDLEEYHNKVNDDGYTKADRHNLQLSLYQNLIEQNLGIKVNQVAIIPIVVNYEKGGNVVTMANRKETIKGKYDKRIEKFGVKPNPNAVELTILDTEWYHIVERFESGEIPEQESDEPLKKKEEASSSSDVKDDLDNEITVQEEELSEEEKKKLREKRKKEERQERRRRNMIAFMRAFDELDEHIIFRYHNNKESTFYIAKVLNGRVRFYNPSTGKYLNSGKSYAKVLERYKEHVAYILHYDTKDNYQEELPASIQNDVAAITDHTLEHDNPIAWVDHWLHLIAPSADYGIEGSYAHAIYEAASSGFDREQIKRGLGKAATNESSITRVYGRSGASAQKLDLVAEAIAETFKKEATDVVQDLLDFMLNYSEDPEQFIRETSSAYPNEVEKIQQAFQVKFGFPITTKYAKTLNKARKEVDQTVARQPKETSKGDQRKSEKAQANQERRIGISEEEFNAFTPNEKHQALRGIFESAKARGKAQEVSVAKIIVSNDPKVKTSYQVVLKNGYKFRVYSHNTHTKLTPEDMTLVDERPDYRVYQAKDLKIVPAYGLNGYSNNIQVINAAGQYVASVQENDKVTNQEKPKEKAKDRKSRMRDIIIRLDKHIEYADAIARKKITESRKNMGMNFSPDLLSAISYKVYAQFLRVVRKAIKAGDALEIAIQKGLAWLKVKHPDVKMTVNEDEMLRAKVYDALGLTKEFEGLVDESTGMDEEDSDSTENTPSMSGMMEKEVVRKIFIDKIRHLFVNYDNGKPWVEGKTFRQLLDMAFEVSEKMPSNTQDIRQYYFDNFPDKEMVDFWKRVNETIEEYDEDTFIRLHAIMQSSLRVGYINFGNYNKNVNKGGDSVKPYLPLISNPAIDKREASQYVRQAIEDAHAYIQKKAAIINAFVDIVKQKAEQGSIADQSAEAWKQMFQEAAKSVDPEATAGKYFRLGEWNALKEDVIKSLKSGKPINPNITKIIFETRLGNYDAEFGVELEVTRKAVLGKLIPSEYKKKFGELRNPSDYYKKLIEEATNKGDYNHQSITDAFKRIMQSMVKNPIIGSRISSLIAMQNKEIAEMMGLPVDVIEAYQGNAALKKGFNSAEEYLAWKILTTNASSSSVLEVRQYLAGMVTRPDIKSDAYKNYRELFKEKVGNNFAQLSAMTDNYSQYSIRKGYSDAFADVTKKRVDAIEFRSWLTDRLTRDIKEESITNRYAENPWVQAFKQGLKIFSLDGLNDTLEKEAANRNGANQADMTLMRLVSFFSTENEQYAGKGNYLTFIEQQADSGKKYMVQAKKQDHSRDDVVQLMMKMPIDKKGNTMKREECLNHLQKNIDHWAKMMRYFGVKGMFRNSEFTTESDFYGKEAEDKLKQMAQNFVFNEIYNKYYIDQFVRGKKPMQADAREIVKRKSSGQGISLPMSVPGGIKKKHRIAVWKDPGGNVTINGSSFNLEFTDGASLIMPWFNKQIETSSGSMFSGQVKVMTFGHINDEQLMVKANDTTLPQLPEDIEDADSSEYMESLEFYTKNPLVRQIVEEAKKADIDRIAFKSSAKIFNEENVNEIGYDLDEDGNVTGFKFPEAQKFVEVDNRDMRVMLDLSNDGSPSLGIIPTQIINTLRMFPSIGSRVDDLIEEAAEIKKQDLLKLFSKSANDLIDSINEEMRNDAEAMQIIAMAKQEALSYNDPIFQNFIGRMAKSIVTKKLLNLVAPKGLCVQSKIPGMTNLFPVRKDEDGFVNPGRAYLPANMKRSPSNPNGLQEGDVFIQIRVPTSGEQQLQVCVVEGFLPSSMKNTIVNDNSVMAISGNDHDGDAVHIWVPYRNVKGDILQENKKNAGDYRVVINKIWDIIVDEYTNSENFNRITRPMDTETINTELLNKFPKEVMHPLLPNTWTKLFKSNTESKDIIERTAATLKVASYLNAYDVQLKKSVFMPRFNHETMRYEEEEVEMSGWNGSNRKKADNMWELGNQTNHATDDPKKGTLSMMNKFISTCGFQDAITSMDASLTYSAIMFCKTPMMQEFIELYDYMKSPTVNFTDREMYDAMYHIITSQAKTLEEKLNPAAIARSIQEVDEWGNRRPNAQYEGWLEPVYSISPKLLNRALEGKPLTNLEKLEVIAYFRTINEINGDMVRVTAAINANTKGVKSVSEANRLDETLNRIGTNQLKMIGIGDQMSQMLQKPSMARAVSNREISNTLFRQFSFNTKLGRSVLNYVKDIVAIAQGTKTAYIDQETNDAIEGAFNAWTAVQALNITESKKELREKAVSIVQSASKESPVKKYLSVNADGVVILNPGASKEMDDNGFIERAQKELEQSLSTESLWLLTKAMVREFGWTRSHWKGSYYTILPISIKKMVSDRMNGMVGILDNPTSDLVDHVIEQVMMIDPTIAPKVGPGTESADLFVGQHSKAGQNTAALYREDKLVRNESMPAFFRVREGGLWVLYRAKHNSQGELYYGVEKVTNAGIEHDIMPWYVEEKKEKKSVAPIENFKETNKSHAEDIYSQVVKWSGNKTQSQHIKVVEKPFAYLPEQKAGKAVVAYRGGKVEESFGNPFTDLSKPTKENVISFIEFVLNSNDAQAVWIRSQLKSGKYKGKPIYYGNTRANKNNEPSHATALDYLINVYEWKLTPSVPPAESKQQSKVLEGDIFDFPGIPIITTNLGGVHGAGLAQAAKEKGLIKYGDGGFKATDSVVQLPVKAKWSDSMSMNNNMELLKDSLRKLIKTAKANPNKQYLLPLAGLGHGEGSVEEIVPLLVKTIRATSNISLVIPSSDVNLGRKGTVRKDRTLENLEQIKGILKKEGLLKNDSFGESSGQQGRFDFPEYLTVTPIKPTNPRLIKFIQERMYKMFPNVKHFSTPEAFQMYLDRMGYKGNLDLNAWGAAFGNAFWINPDKPHQETWIHEHAHIYWNLLPENDPIKARLIKYYGSVENAIIAVGKVGIDIAEAEMNNGMVGRLTNWLKLFWAKVRDMLWGSATPIQYARIMADAVWNKGAFETNHNDFREYVLEYMTHDPTQSFTSQEEAIQQIEDKLGKKIQDITIEDLSKVFKPNYSFKVDYTEEISGVPIEKNDEGETFWESVIHQMTGNKLLSPAGQESGDESDLFVVDINLLANEIFGENYQSLKAKGISDEKYKSQVKHLDKLHNKLSKMTTKAYVEVISLTPNEGDFADMTPELILKMNKIMTDLLDETRSWGLDPATSQSTKLLYSVHKIVQSQLMAHHFKKAIDAELESDSKINRVYIKALREFLYPETMKPIASFLDSTFGKGMVRPFKAPANVQSDMFQLRNQIVARAAQKSVRHQVAISAKIKAAFDAAKKAGLSNSDISFQNEDNKMRYYIYPGSDAYNALASSTDAKSRAIIAFADAYNDIVLTYVPLSITGQIEDQDNKAEAFKVAYTDMDIADHKKKFGTIDTILDRVSTTALYDHIHPGPDCKDDQGEMVTLGEYKDIVRQKLRSGALGKNKVLAAKKYLDLVNKQEKLAETMYRSGNHSDAKGYVISRTRSGDMLRGIQFKETETSAADWSLAADKMISQYAFMKEIEDEMPVISYMENHLLHGGDQQKNLGLFMQRFNDLQLYGRAPESNLSPKWQRILKMLQEWTALKFMGLNVGAAVWNAAQGFTSNIRDYGFKNTMKGYLLVLQDYFTSKRNLQGKPTLGKLGEIFLTGKFVKILEKEGIVQIGKDWSTSSSSKIINKLKKLAFSPTALVEFMNQGVSMYAMMTPAQRAAYDDQGNVIDPANALTDDEWLKLIARVQQTHGSYHPMFKRLIGSTPEGASTISMKTWLADTWWIHMGDDEYNGITDTHQRGMIRSSQRWMKGRGAKILANMKLMDAQKAEEYFNQLDEVDKLNLYRLARELGMMLAFAMLMSAGDDDEQSYKASKKMLSDLSFVYNLTNYQNIIKGGLPVGTTIVDALDFTKNVFGATFIGGAEYQYRVNGGMWGDKGDSKLPMYTINMLPGQSVIKQIANASQSE